MPTWYTITVQSIDGWKTFQRQLTAETVDEAVLRVKAEARKYVLGYEQAREWHVVAIAELR